MKSTLLTFTALFILSFAFIGCQEFNQEEEFAKELEKASNELSLLNQNNMNPTNKNDQTKIKNLEEALDKYVADKLDEQGFYEWFFKEEIFLLTIKDDTYNEDYHEIKKGEKLSFLSLKSGELIAFTSTDRIFDNGIITTQVNYKAMKGKDLMQFIGNPLVKLNPFSNVSTTLTIKK